MVNKVILTSIVTASTIIVASVLTLEHVHANARAATTLQCQAIGGSASVCEIQFPDQTKCVVVNHPTGAGVAANLSCKITQLNPVPEPPGAVQLG